MSKPKLQDLLNTRHEVVYGSAERVSPLIRRVTAPNPGAFTFRGTGTFLVGTAELAVIDPGPDDPRHINALLKAAEGRQIAKILVTHTHSDHSPAARPLARLTGAPILGFGPHPSADTSRMSGGSEAAAASSAPQTPTDASRTTSSEVEEPGDWDFVPDETLAHGDLVEGDGWTLECLHTPGHISNHLCFALREERCVFTGDHVMGWSSVVIPPPDGSLGDYLASLRLLLDRGKGGRDERDRAYFPTHGPAIANPAEFAEALLEHRLERSRQIVECLRTAAGGLDVGGLDVGDLVQRIYVGLSEKLIPAAETTVLAHLIHLVEQGEAACDGDPEEASHFFAA